MASVWLHSALWLGLALLASLISIRVSVSVALIEIVVGGIAGNLVGLQITDWVNFLAGFGAILLTFLAGTEIEPRIVRKHFWSSMTIGVMGFVAPYLGVLAYAHYWHRVELATGTDSRYRALHHLSRGRLRGNDRNRLQQNRDREDYSGRLLHQ
jgi:Kef-type K+ transport system membrane component KefB